LKLFRKGLRQFNSDNKGLSLVELIVTVLLMGVISSMIVVFISTSRSNYELISTESSLQTEAQAATGFIYDMLLEAEDVTFYGADAALDASVVGGTGADGVKVLAAKNGDKVNVVLYDIGQKKLRYRTVSAAAVEATSASAITVLKDMADGGDSLMKDKYALLAEYVTGMEYAKLPSGAAITYSNVNLEFEYAGRQYKTSIDVKGRNAKGGI
jgi:prepilin-type N-terminal cleavage/methylation domain-containing protein